MPSVKVALDNLPQDADVEVPYLGVFKNNTTTEVDQAKWDRYVKLSPVGQEHAEEDTLEISTAKQRELGEQLREARRAIQEGNIEEQNKSDLVETARAVGVDEPKGKKKEELVQEVKQATGQETEQTSAEARTTPAKEE